MPIKFPAVIATDTIYGLVAPALDRGAVEHLRAIRRKAIDKPLIILISGPADLGKFGIRTTPRLKKTVSKFWPGPTSIILPLPKTVIKKLAYLHRGTDTLAFRLPAKKSLRQLLRATGPLVAPSANLPNQPPARTIAEAKKYFGNKVATYLDGGRLDGKPSTLIAIDGGEVKILR